MLQQVHPCRCVFSRSESEEKFACEGPSPARKPPVLCKQIRSNQHAPVLQVSWLTSAGGACLPAQNAKCEDGSPLIAVEMPLHLRREVTAICG